MTDEYSYNKWKELALDSETALADKERELAELHRLLDAAINALRSYQYGNGSPDLAETIADRIEAALRHAVSEKKG